MVYHCSVLLMEVDPIGIQNWQGFSRLGWRSRTAAHRFPTHSAHYMRKLDVTGLEEAAPIRGLVKIMIGRGT